MNMLDLVEDVDYQQKYSYEKRADLFNKYGISTSEKFFVPIWGLSQYIKEICLGEYLLKGYREFGHGQRVLNRNLLNESCGKLDKPDNRRIRVKAYKRICIYNYIPNIEETKLEGKMRQIIAFDIESKTLYLNNYGFLNMCKIPRDLYEKIDEWLIDFEYEKW